LSGWSSRWLLVGNLQGERWGIGLEREQQSFSAGGGAMFDAELQLLTVATQIKI
jgi:hypothetical protein